MTVKLFLDNPRMLEFQAEIKKTKKLKEGPAICLDKTAFYPTSGGQPFDTGLINDIRVTNVWEEDAEIWHRLEEFPTEDQITGFIDWDRRFDHMQQHTGQHLLSAVFFDELNSNTIGFHIGTKFSTIDLDIQNLKYVDIDKIESITNRKVWDDYPVVSRYPSRSELQELQFRKPPQVIKNPRLIQIGNYDVCACGGTHVSRTGEIGIIKITQTERYKGGFRVTFLCGKRAIKDYQQLHKIVKKTSANLSIHSDDLPNTIKRLIAEANDNLQAYKHAKKELLTLEAGQMWKDAEVRNGLCRITAHYENRPFSDLKIIAAILREKPSTLIFLATSVDSKLNLLCARSQDLTDINSNTILKNAVIRLGGKGGGTPEMAQGGAPLTESELILKTFKTSIQSHVD